MMPTPAAKPNASTTDEHDVHDADAADEEADGGDAGQDLRQRLRRVVQHAETVRLIPNGEVVGRSDRQLCDRRIAVWVSAIADGIESSELTSAQASWMRS
jgi:hypothetical protein